MRLGLGRLGLSPEVFWTMTPVEFQRALEGAGVVPVGGVALTRTGLEGLMARFPDSLEEAPDQVRGSGQRGRDR